MQESPVLTIVHLCLEIDTTARDVYAKLHSLCTHDELKAFWKEMSEEEAQHIEFWRQLELLGEQSGLPDLFEDPGTVIQELQLASKRSIELLERCKSSCTIGSAFVLAYRTEFYLLHPALALLFHTLGHSAGELNPEKEYASHIERFINMLASHGEVTPELELLGETLQRLWRENRALALQATRDDLTGLFNRRGFFATAEQLAFLAQRNESMIGVMMMDLDHFKLVNDRLGHKAGDSVLNGTADLITRGLRTSDVAGRYGGEEFIVLLPSIREENTSQIAEKIRRFVELNPPQGIPVTISIGVVEGKMKSAPREELQALIRQADAALYQAKASGRNRVVCYSPDSREGAGQADPSGSGQPGRSI